MIQGRAVRFHQVGGPEVLKLETVIVPDPQMDEIVVRQKAVGLNFIDTYYRSGLYPTELPSGLGTEGAGIVEMVGKNVKHVAPGDRVVYCQGKLGADAEFHTVLGKNVVKLPEGISFEEGAAVMLKGLTAHYLLKQLYPLKAGDMILFHAAAGGVGSIACQWARHLGIKLIGTVGSDEKMKIAKEHGAFEVINYQKENVVVRVMEITQGKKVPVVLDGVGKSTLDISLDCLSKRGLLVSFGNASGPVTGVNLSVLAQHGSLSVTRPILADFVDTHEKLSHAANELFDLVLKKVIKVTIQHRYSLDQVTEAHRDLQARLTTGSSILIP